MLAATSNQAINSTESTQQLSVLRKDFISLLSLLYGSVTKVSLVLKPSSPTYSASVTPLNDVSNQIAGLSHCIQLFDPTRHGASFIREIESTYRDVVSSVQSLAQIFLYFVLDTSGPSTSSGTSGEGYLVTTGAIHARIEQARGPVGVSADNASAVCKIWNLNQECLEDGLRELAETIEDQGSSSTDDEDEDDGWNELGIGSGEKMSSAEFERSKKVSKLYRSSWN